MSIRHFDYITIYEIRNTNDFGINILLLVTLYDNTGYLASFYCYVKRFLFHCKCRFFLYKSAYFNTIFTVIKCIIFSLLTFCWKGKIIFVIQMIVALFSCFEKKVCLLEHSRAKLAR